MAPTNFYVPSNWITAAVPSNWTTAATNWVSGSTTSYTCKYTTDDWIALSDFDWSTVDLRFRKLDNGNFQIGRKTTIEFKDGTFIYIEDDGNYRIDDSNKKVIYQSTPDRLFNPMLNAADLVARFIDYVREVEPRVKKQDIATLPLEVFVHWLIIEAAERDGDEVPADVQRVPDSRLIKAKTLPRCVLPSCGRFIPRVSAANGFNYCNAEHAANHLKLLRAA